MVPASQFSFHVARLLIANFNRNNNRKQATEPGCFTARKNVVKKLKFKLPATCEHSLTAHEQQFSQKPCPSLQKRAKVTKATATVHQPQAGCEHQKKTPKSKQIKCKHKTQLPPGL